MPRNKHQDLQDKVPSSVLAQTELPAKAARTYTGAAAAPLRVVGWFSMLFMGSKTWKKTLDKKVAALRTPAATTPPFKTAANEVGKTTGKPATKPVASSATA